MAMKIIITWTKSKNKIAKVKKDNAVVYLIQTINHAHLILEKISRISHVFFILLKEDK